MKLAGSYKLNTKKEIVWKALNDSSILKSFNGEAVVITNNLAKGILIRGIEKKEINKLIFFKENLIDGDLKNFGNNKIIIGKHLAIELGVVVGDKINIMPAFSGG